MMTAARAVGGLIDPGVVHEHRRLTHALGDETRRGFDRFATGDVAVEALNRIAGPLRQLLEPDRRHGLEDIQCGDASPGSNQRLRPHGTQRAAGTSDDGDAVVERKASVHERAATGSSDLLSTSNDRKSSSWSGLSVVRPITLSRSYGGMPPPGDFMTTSFGPITWPVGRLRGTTRLLPLFLIGARSLSERL